MSALYYSMQTLLDYYSSFVVVAFFNQASETRQSKRLSAKREAFFSTIFFLFLFSPAKSAVCEWDGWVGFSRVCEREVDLPPSFAISA